MKPAAVLEPSRLQPSQLLEYKYKKNTYHQTTILHNRSIAKQPEIAGRRQRSRSVELKAEKKLWRTLWATKITYLSTKEKHTHRCSHLTCMYSSSMVPPLAVGSTLSTSTARQSRNHDGLSLRISATCKFSKRSIQHIRSINKKIALASTVKCTYPGRF